MGYQEPLRRMLDDMREESAANVLLQEEAQTISKTLSSDKTLFVSKWTDYDRDDVVSLWRATCLSVGLNPDHKAARSEDFAKRVVALGFAKDDCIKGLKEVLRRYKNVLINAKNSNSDLSTADELRKTIELSAFGRWAAKKKDWELPKGFPGTPSPFLSTDQPNLTSLRPEFVMAEDVSAGVKLDKAALLVKVPVQGNSTKTRRKDSIDPVIELAQAKCRNPKDTNQVWAQMQVLAQVEHPPFLASMKEGLKYHKNGVDAYFTRDALDKRLHPEKRKPPAVRR